jgi:hypothetical protein
MDLLCAHLVLSVYSVCREGLKVMNMLTHLTWDYSSPDVEGFVQNPGTKKITRFSHEPSEMASAEGTSRLWEVISQTHAE